MGPDELRDRAGRLFRASTNGKAVTLRPGQLLLGEVPLDPGTLLRVVYSPATNPRDTAVFVQVAALGPDGERVSASGSIRIKVGALAAVADLLAEAMDRAEAQSHDAPNGAHRAGEEGRVTP